MPRNVEIPSYHTRKEKVLSTGI